MEAKSGIVGLQCSLTTGVYVFATTNRRGQAILRLLVRPMPRLVFDHLEERWEEALGYLKDGPEEVPCIVEEDDARISPFGSFVRIYWQPREEVWERWEEPVTPESHVKSYRVKLELLGHGPGLQRLLEGVSTSCEHFLANGILDIELKAARAKQRDTAGRK
ncbi:hypothetical protein CGRA01v4_13011 [Colletotrichum graminicola]|nr:hypothetical protein CGRA01v4_13011 [Colletotrichum graminicola]